AVGGGRRGVERHLADAEARLVRRQRVPFVVAEGADTVHRQIADVEEDRLVLSLIAVRQRGGGQGRPRRRIEDVVRRAQEGEGALDRVERRVGAVGGDDQRARVDRRFGRGGGQTGPRRRRH